jgi:hypothetical protein
MVNVTLSIPNELKQKMDTFAEINWSAVAREAFDEKIRDMDFIKKFRAKSTITEQDAIKWGKEVSRALSSRLRAMK